MKMPSYIFNYGVVVVVFFFRCKHYFCEKCALHQYTKSKRCFVCGEPTSGIYNPAKGERERNLINAPCKQNCTNLTIKTTHLPKKKSNIENGKKIFQKHLKLLGDGAIMYQLNLLYL